MDGGAGERVGPSRRRIGLGGLILLVTILVGASAAQASVIQIQARNADSEPTDEFSTTEGIYAFAPTDMKGGYACVVADRPGSGCMKGYAPVPPFNQLNVPVNAPGDILVGGPYRLVGFSDPKVAQRDAVSPDTFFVHAPTCDPNQAAVCPDGLAAFTASACEMQHAALMLLAMRTVGFIAQGMAASFVPLLLPGSGFVVFVVEAAVTFEAVQAIGSEVWAKGFATGGAMASEAEEHYREICSPPGALGFTRGRGLLQVANPDYTQVAQPIFSTLSPPSDPGDHALFDAMDRQQAYSGAVATALDRYRAAKADGATDSEALQLHALADYDRHLVTALNDSEAAERELASRIATDTTADAPITSAQIDNLRAVQARVTTDGFTGDERAQLSGLGFTSDQIDAVAADFASQPTDALVADRRPSEQLTAAADDLDLSVPGLEQFAAEADRAADEMLPRASIEISVATDPSPPVDAPSFHFEGGAVGPFDLGDGGVQSFQDVTPGTQGMTVTAPDGYELESGSCDDGGSATPSTVDITSGVLSIGVDAAEPVHCSLTFRRMAKIVIATHTVPSGWPDPLAYSGDLGAFTVGDGGEHDAQVAPGVYTVAQQPGDDASVSDIACDDGGAADPSVPDVAAGSVAIHAETGETVRCEFTDTLARGRLVLSAATQPADPRGRPVLRATGDGIEPVELGDQAARTIPLATGSHTLALDALSGQIDSASCDDGDSATPSAGDSGTLTAGIDPGEIVRCLVSLKHPDPGALVIANRVTPAMDTTGLQWTFEGDDVAGAFVLADGEHSSTTVWPAGTYAVHATAPPEFALRDASCDDGASAHPSSAVGGAVTAAVEPGETVTCTYTWGLLSLRSTGPLSRVYTSPTLNCAVDHLGDHQPEFFADSACGTFVTAGDTVFGPAEIPAGGGLGQTPFTPVDQSFATGSGTRADPLRVVTTVDAGATGVRLRQIDTYVAGEEAYRTTVTVTDTGQTPVSGQLYRAADCFLQDSDIGYGTVDAATGAVACRGIDQGPSGPTPGSRIEQWFPLTSGSHLMEDSFSTVWSRIGSRLAFPDTCLCDEPTDDGAGLSWRYDLAPGESRTFQHLTTFSPLGHEPLTLSEHASPASVPGGGRVRFRIEVANPNTQAVGLTTVSAVLPPGFGYVTGSTAGAGEPAASGRTLTWTGLDDAPAAGTITLSFDADAPSQPGEYDGTAAAEPELPYALAAPGGAHVTVTAALEPTPTPTPSSTPAATPTPTPTAAPAATPTPAPTAPPQGGVRSEQARDLGLPSARACVSRRRFGIRLKGKLRSARVWVDGRHVKVVRKGGRLVATVDLRGLRTGRFTVLVRAVGTDGRKVREQRRYRTCAKRRR